MKKNENYVFKLIQYDDLDEGHLFISKNFLKYQSEVFSTDVINFGIYDSFSKKYLAQISFSGKNDIWKTPVTGSFGGASSTKEIHIDVYKILLRESEKYLFTHTNAKEIIINLPPNCFPDSSSIVANILFNDGWILNKFDVNHHINICSPDKYLKIIGNTKVKKIKRLVKSGASFSNVPIANLKDVYSVIEENRKSQGFPMTMSYNSMKDLSKNFEDYIKLFIVKRNGEILSSAICLNLTPNYMYVFYWGEINEYRNESPVVFLAMQLADYCYKSNIDILDIGTSSDNSAINSGLSRFKEGIGCKWSHKLSYSKKK
tara:strand:+ start:110 stop:1057 length:948 start_codon:yes stop_codon:yes gene_type:complete